MAKAARDRHEIVVALLGRKASVATTAEMDAEGWKFTSALETLAAM
jgi:hypothetical protein